ncbi:MAG TPA: VOC family protein [Acidimicrobiales bacterium]|nr:VOC family protein [Acidimicrobiales bacterium]
MNDELDQVRELRPDRRRPAEPAQTNVLSRQKEALMAQIAEGTGYQAPRRHDPAMYPRLAYLDEVAALDYLIQVFGFTERREDRMGTGAPDDPMLAWLDFGDGVVMIGRSDDACHQVHRIYSPAEVGRATAMINVRVHDIDSHYLRAVEAGALVTMPLEDAFYGFRRYEANDPEGNRWHFHESFADIRARGGTVEQES